GDAVGAGADDLLDVVVRDPADAYQRNTDLAPEFPQQIGTDQLEVGLAAGGEHRAHGHVVGAVGLGCPRLSHAVGGDAEDHARAQQWPGQAGRQVVLAQVDAVGPDGQGQVHTIVDDEGHAVGRAAGPQPLGQWQQAAGRPLLLTQLNHAGAAGDGSGEQVEEVPAPRGGTVEDHVERG